MIDRRDIISQNLARKNARKALREDGATAKILLHPSAIFGRWKQRQISRAERAKDASVRVVKKNAPLIGTAAIAALLFAARKPILRAARKLRNKG